MSIKISVGHGGTLFGNMVIQDNVCELVYASTFGYTTDSKLFAAAIDKKDTIYCCSRYYNTCSGRYTIESSKVPDSDFIHTVIARKDNRFEDSGVDTLLLFCFFETEGENPYDFNMAVTNSQSFPETLEQAVYDKLDRYYPWPVLKEWVPFLISELASMNYVHPAQTTTMDDKPINGKWLNCLVLNAPVMRITEVISNGLKDHAITMNGSNDVSIPMSNVTGLDSYLDATNDVHARRIQEMFKPCFVPGEDKYSDAINDVTDYQEYMAHLKLYPAQKALVQGTANSLKKKDFMFLVIECGGGKTATSLTTVMTYHGNSKRWMTNVVMCPGHLVNYWQREIERLCPMSEAVILENFSQLKELEPKIKNQTMRRKHLWLVVSKERAKFGFEERPAAIWSDSKKCFVCPECGQPLYTVTYEGRGRYRQEVRHRMDETSFRVQRRKLSEQNLYCRNTVKIYNKKTGEEEWVKCGAKLWEPNVKAAGDTESDWVKLGKAGWVMRKHIDSLTREHNITTKYTCIPGAENASRENPKKFTVTTPGLLERYEAIETPSKADGDMLVALASAASGDIPVQVAPRRYSIAKYMRQYLKGDIDFFIADEVHELKGDTEQGEAFGDFVRTARKSLGLTGTLLNGKASSLFYLLYRTCPSLMKEEGFDYNSVDKFIKEYGVLKATNTYENNNGRLGRRRGSGGSVKELPGISPLIFTKFLMENCSFLGLEDISEGLPGYREIPVPCEMDSDVSQGYDRITRAFRQNCGGRYSKGMKTMSQWVNLMSVYPDQPFDQYDIVHPETGASLISPDACDEAPIRGKEQALIDLCIRKKEAGEKVLVYYHFVNRTKLSKRLKDLLTNNGITVAVMDTGISSEDREAWIAKKVEDGVDVVICNPKLVATGLNLLDFTTIVFYEIDYNLYTFRQASRRSWRLNQENDIEVYLLYYRETVQEACISLMAEKLKAAMAIEGKFSEEGMAAMANNNDILTQIASSVTNDIKETVDVKGFEKLSKSGRQDNERHAAETHLIDMPRRRLVAEYEPGTVLTKRKLNRVVQKCIVGEAEKRFIDNPFELLGYVG